MKLTPYHYVFLLIVFLAVALYFLIRPANSSRILTSGSRPLPPPGLNIDMEIWNQCLQEDDEDLLYGDLRENCDTDLHRDLQRHLCNTQFFPNRSCAKVCSAVNKNFTCN